MPHLFTVDVEEYFQVAALAPYAPRDRWPMLPRRVDVGVDRLLELLARHQAHGTFFVLGSVAEWNPAVVRRIAAAGHEIASHGWSHRPVTTLTPGQFRGEAVRSRALLAELSGQPVQGFRAPNFSIIRSCDWAFDVLIEAGYSYDSSVFPSRQSGRGFAGRQVRVLERPGGSLIEIPLTSLDLGFARIPAAGGAWFRLLPYALTRRAFRQAAGGAGPGVFYIHPWELDADQPRFRTDMATRLRHYGGLGRVHERLERLLGDFEFVSVAGWLGTTAVSQSAGRATSEPTGRPADQTEQRTVRFSIS